MDEIVAWEEALTDRKEVVRLMNEEIYRFGSGKITFSTNNTFEVTEANWEEAEEVAGSKYSVVTQTDFERQLARARVATVPEEDMVAKWAGDPAIAKVYDSLLAGDNIVDLNSLVSKLAVAPLFRQGKTLNRTSDGSSILFKTGGWSLQFGGYIRPTERRWQSATIPLVPKTVIPEDFTRRDRDQALILFEPVWSELPVRPTDPALLTPVSGSLYKVRAVWDLTPIEAAAISSAIKIRRH